MAEEQMDELMKIFPVKLREILSQVTWYREDLEEIRIRIQRPVQFVTSQASFYLDSREKRLMTQAKGGLALGEEDLREILTYVCEYSRYAYARQMRQGFLALDGGIRLGLCGQYMAEEDGRIGMEYPMYFSIRIPHEKKGCAAWIEPWLIEGETFLHTLILAAPGMGKTTFLRDLVRVLSDRPTCRGLALIDERYELAAANFGIPQNDVGLHTDVYSGYAKEAGCMQAIRTMAPQILAVDEIGGKKDLESLVYAMHCGVGVLATMHAGSLLEYQQKREWEPLLEKCHFRRLLWIDKKSGRRQFFLYDEAGELLCVKESA